MPAAAKARLGAVVARIADLLLMGPSGPGSVAPAAHVRVRNGRLLMVLTTGVLGAYVITFPVASVPVEAWPLLLAAGFATGALIVWLLTTVRPGSWLAMLAAVPTTLAVAASCWIGQAWYDDLPLFMTLLLAGHSVYLGWRSAAAVAVLGGVAMYDPHQSPGDPATRVAILLALAAILEVTRRGEALALARVQAAEQRLRTTLDALREGVRIVDPQLRHLYVNEAGARRTGLPREQILGRTLPELYPADVSQEVHGYYEACLRGEGPQHYERTVVRADGTTEWLAIALERVPEGLFIMTRDVTPEREAQLAREFAARVAEAFRLGVAAVPAGATVAEAGAIVCRRLASIPELSLVAVVAYLGDDEGLIVAVDGQDPPVAPGFRIPPERVREELALAAGGPWVEHIAGMAGRSAWQEFVLGNGFLARAHIPIQAGDRVVGLIAIGTRDAHFAPILRDRLPGLSSIAAAATVLMADRLQAYRDHELERRALEALIQARAFHAVFAPVVDLATADVVGYEGLTRFSGGRAARDVFASAARLGLGQDLRLAVLGQAFTAAQGLPLGPWLQVRVPSAMLRPGAPVIGLFAEARRPLVIDVVDDGVADAQAIRESIADLGGVARLAVDKAGVTQLSFDNILALRPAFVNLAPRLAHGCNLDLGRQALITAMVRFARSAGCRIVATGVASRDEAQTLAGLGVDFARGPWFGDFALAPAPARAPASRAARGDQA